MKILLLTDKMDIGGAETHVFSLARELRRTGNRVAVASSGGALARSLGLPHYTLPLDKKDPASLVFCYFRLIRIVKSGGFDRIHSHARLPSLLGYLVAKKLGIRFICTAHAFFGISPLRRVLSRWGDATVAVSEDLKQYLIEGYALSPENITVIPNGVDIDLFSPADTGLSAPVVAFLSRLDGDCALGAYLLCDIAPRLARRFPDLRIAIGGGGDALVFVRERAEAVNSTLGFECVRVVGEVSDSSAFLRSASVFVGVSRAAIEAGLCGLPVILCGNEGYLGRLTDENFDLALSNNFCCRGCGRADADRLFEAVCDAVSSSREESLALMKRMRAVLDVRATAGRTLSIYEKVALPQGRPEALLCGYYGFGNMGDDALLRSSIERARREFPEVSVGALTRRPRRDGARFGVACRSRRLPFAVLSCGKLIFGGGTLLQEDTSLRSLCYYSALIFLARARGAKIYLWGNGLGRPRSAIGQWLMKRCLDRCHYIGLRDGHSVDIAKSLTENPNIVLEDDLALSVVSAEESRARYLLFGLFGSYRDIPPFVIVAPRREGRTGELIRALKRAKREGYRLVFVAMHPDGDGRFSERLCRCLGGVMLRGICYSDLEAIARFSGGVYSMRLHALIAAKQSGVPFYSFSDDEKIKGYFG